MSPDFRKALQGLSGRAAHPDGASPSVGAGTPAGPAVDQGNGSAAIATGAPLSSSPSSPSSPSLSLQPSPLTPAIVGSSSQGARPASPAGTAQPDSGLDLQAQAQAILSDVIADLVREAKLEPIEEVEKRRLTREQEFARLLEDQPEVKPTSIFDHPFDPSGAWGHESEEVDRSMRRGRKMRERRGRGRLF